MLGRQQIAGPATAISELFKNAHDAYGEGSRWTTTDPTAFSFCETTELG